MSQTIFVVEDDADIARLVAHHLEGAGFGVQVFGNASQVIAHAEKARPSAFLLDVMVPGGDGFELCRQIRQNSALAATPIVFLTAKSSEVDRVLGLELGGDDYITKPFSPRELLARIKAVLRRFERPLAPEVLRFGNVEIDSGAMVVRVNHAQVEMTATEFRLLQYLAQRPGRVFSRDQLLDAVWRDTAFVTPRSVDVYVRRIREKIESNPEEPQLIRTIRGAGYRFEGAK